MGMIVITTKVSSGIIPVAIAIGLGLPTDRQDNVHYVVYLMKSSYAR